MYGVDEEDILVEATEALEYLGCSSSYSLH